MESLEVTKAQLAQALSDEIKARSVFPKKAVLTNGLRAAMSDERAVYRFEIPESLLFEPSLSIQCTLGTKLSYWFPAVVADVHHQFVFFLFPFDMGELISELTCEWNPSETTESLLNRVQGLPQNGIVSALVNRDFSENALAATKEPIFPSSFTESQRDAVKNSIARKISIVIGERKRGKTGVAASLIFSALREGKRVLYLTPSSDGLHDCMEEAISLNAAVAEESIVVLDAGMGMLTPLSMPLYAAKGSDLAAHSEGLKKLVKVIAADHEYDRVEVLIQRLSEKQRQITEASDEADAIKTELQRLQNASMLERMKQRINKGDIENVQAQLQQKLALVDRLKQHVATLTKEQFKKESQLPYQPKEKKEIEKLAATRVSLQPTIPDTIASVRCVAATVNEALKIDKLLLGEFDVVCIDDAHALNLPGFFWCASLAREQCFILADVTEQPPQSVCQFESARTWLQKSYFSYYQQQEGDQRRFSIGLLPKNAASELIHPELPPSLFEACLAAAIDQKPIAPGVKGKVWFINTEDQRSISAQYLGKKKILPYNEANGKRVVDCIKHALLSGSTTQSDILVVVPPSGQSTYLRELLKAHQMHDIEIATLGSVRLCVKRAIIFDTTVAGIDFTLRSIDDKKSGAVRVTDTLNTLLCTVREDFYTIADLSHFTTRYKDRVITRLLGVLAGKSESVGTILNAVRRFDDLSPELKKKVLRASAEEKQSADYRTKLEQSRSSPLDTSKPIAQQSIALAERKLQSDIRSAILRVLAKREFINIVAQYLESYPLYRSTQETAKFSAALSEAECENENDFKNVMDMWNVLIYETSDIHKTDHPLAAKAKVEAKLTSDIQDIYAYYHSDLELVVEVGKQKLAQSIQKVFNDCIGKKPVTPSDWMKSYLVFLGRMEKYLDTVINQIRA